MIFFKKDDTPAAPTPKDKRPQFPKVSGSNLNEKAFNLPTDFEGERNIIFVAFQQWHQSQVDSWMPTTKKIAEGDKTLRFYEIPALSAMLPIARKFIDNGMRSGIPDKAVRAITITLYINKENFKAWLNLPNEKQIYILVVDKKGNVLWREEGAFTEEKGKALATYFAIK
jgi:ATP10 protein